MATKYHAEHAGLKLPEHNVNDIDLVTTDLKQVSRDVANDFLIYHYHPNPAYPFLALVDPVNRIIIDIFPWDKNESGGEMTTIGKWEVKIASAEDQLVNNVLDCQRIITDQKVDGS